MDKSTPVLASAHHCCYAGSMTGVSHIETPEPALSLPMRETCCSHEPVGVATAADRCGTWQIRSGSLILDTNNQRSTIPVYFEGSNGLPHAPCSTHVLFGANVGCIDIPGPRAGDHPALCGCRKTRKGRVSALFARDCFGISRVERTTS